MSSHRMPSRPKVLLVNPSWRKRSGSKLAALPDLYPPMGLGSVAAALRHAGFRAVILDLPILRVREDQDERVMALIEAQEPDIVGFTTVTMTYPTVRRLATRLRAAHPEIPILLGGVHVTNGPHLPLADKCFDYSVAGEGEWAAIAICRGLVAGAVPRDIPGVGYHQVEQPFVNPRAAVDLDDLPPTAYDLFDLDTYRRAFQRMAIMTQRGCNARCIFCAAGQWLPQVKVLPLARVMHELEYLVRERGFRFINFFDSNFTYRREWVHTLCDEIIRRGLSFRWRCFSKANGVDLALFRKMRAAGCSHVLFGVESSHDATLKLVHKGNRRRHVEAAFALAREAGIRRVAYSIVGLPGETASMVRDTIDFLERIDAEWNVVSPISLLPGTPLFDRMSEYQMVLTDPDWQHTSQGDATASNSLMTAEEIEQLTEEAFVRLNMGRETYEWHLEAARDPGTCPHISLMSLIDPPGDSQEVLA